MAALLMYVFVMVQKFDFNLMSWFLNQCNQRNLANLGHGEVTVGWNYVYDFTLVSFFYL